MDKSIQNGDAPDVKFIKSKQKKTNSGLFC